jgi:S1-C subfamily serine protease
MRHVASYLAVALLAAAVTYGLAQVNQPAPPNRPADNSPPALKPPPRPQPAERPVAPRPVPPPQQDLDLSPEEKDNVRIYREVNRSVVNITTRSLQVDDIFLLDGPREGSGSGSILDKKGHVLTNNHVVEDARQIAVTLFDGGTHPARLVGADPNNDLAVLKIDTSADRLFPIRWGDSTRLLVGVRVYAIGNPFGLERTLTTGIVSSLNRSLRTENRRLICGIIQTDAAINPGNSGGPLLNRRGELIGITTAIISRAGQNSGIGLAIPAGTARRVVDELIRHGKVIRPDCGIFSVYELDRGLLIARLAPDGPARKAGLRGPQLSVVNRGGFLFRTIDRSRADLIVAVDGKPVKSLDDLLSYVESKKPGDRVVMTVLREGEELKVTVELEQASG